MSTTSTPISSGYENTVRTIMDGEDTKPVTTSVDTSLEPFLISARQVFAAILYASGLILILIYTAIYYPEHILAVMGGCFTLTGILLGNE